MFVEVTHTCCSGLDRQRDVNGVIHSMLEVCAHRCSMSRSSLRPDCSMQDWVSGSQILGSPVSPRVPGLHCVEAGRSSARRGPAGETQHLAASALGRSRQRPPTPPDCTAGPALLPCCQGPGHVPTPSPASVPDWNAFHACACSPACVAARGGQPPRRLPKAQDAMLGRRCSATTQVSQATAGNVSFLLHQQSRLEVAFLHQTSHGLTEGSQAWAALTFCKVSSTMLPPVVTRAPSLS